MERTLFIHIGHFKTGSSFLQEVWRLNADVLSAHHIFYPVPKRIQLGGFGKITSGNGGYALKGKRHLEEILSTAPQQSSLLLSSEHLYSQILDHKNCGFVKHTAAQFGFKRISFLLFLRDPVELGTSFYDQYVKRSGEKRSIDDFFDESDAVVNPTRSEMVIDAITPVADLHLRNYTKVRKSILPITCDWTGVPFDKLKIPDIQEVNRSLTCSERELLRSLNMAGAQDTFELANALCEQLPEIQSEKSVPSLSCQRAFMERHQSAIERLNRRLPPSESLSMDLLTPPADISHSFTPDQIKLISEYVIRHQKATTWLGKKFKSLCKRLHIR